MSSITFLRIDALWRPLIRALAVDLILAVLLLFLLDASLAFFALLSAVAHNSLLPSGSHAKLSHALQILVQATD
jgi:hypothetical protein